MAAKVAEYACPTVASGDGLPAMVSRARTSMENVAEAAFRPVASVVSATRPGARPAAVGVPEMEPLVASRVSPAGSVPADRAQA